VGGNFIDINPAGISIQGTLVMINSGGAAGSGSGSSPDAPVTPGKPPDPNDPAETDNAKPGDPSMLSDWSKPPKPVKYSPQAIALKSAAKSGAPFCAT
jgi:type VI secretion system secreted protein VgrG